MTLHTL